MPAPGGAVAVSEVAPAYETLDEATVPNLTVEVAVNPVPVMSTEVPPAAGPLDGLTAVTTGGTP